MLWECQSAFPVPDKEELNLENSIFPSSETGCYNTWCHGRMTNPVLLKNGFFRAFLIYLYLEVRTILCAGNLQ